MFFNVYGKGSDDIPNSGDCKKGPTQELVTHVNHKIERPALINKRG